MSDPQSKPHWGRRILRNIFVLTVLGLCSLSGLLTVLNSDSGRNYSTSLGVININANPDLDGDIDFYIPLTNWGVKAKAYNYPVTIKITAQTVARETVMELAARPTTTRSKIKEVSVEGREIVKHEMARSMRVAMAGAIMGGIIGGSMLGVIFLRRRYLVEGIVAGITVALVFGTTAYFSLNQVNLSSFESPTYYADGSELPALLKFSSQVTEARANYSNHYEKTLSSFAKLLSYAKMDGSPVQTKSFILASDTHLNSEVTLPFQSFAADRTVVYAGDYGQLGHKWETDYARTLIGKANNVIAISGNHDTPKIMAALSQEGATVLGSDSSTICADGFSFAGYPDPLANGERKLAIPASDLLIEQKKTALWWDRIDRLYGPQIIVIHQPVLAEYLVKYIQGVDADRQLLVLTGHTHVPKITSFDNIIMINGGTLGAGGIFAAGKEKSSFAQVNYSGQTIVSADMIVIDPIGGKSEATQHHIDLNLTTNRKNRCS